MCSSDLIITEHLPKILDSINISKIVRERINEMDVNETEKLIFQVMDKELKAIVWLGALLGLVMGSINCLIFFKYRLWLIEYHTDTEK